MKKVVLSLLALMLLPCAASAWADADDQARSAQPAAAAQPVAAQPAAAPAAEKLAAPAAEIAAKALPQTQREPLLVRTPVAIELKGAAKSVAALVADLEKDAVYKDAGCSTGKKPGKTAKVTCSKGDSALMAYLLKNGAGVHWSISGAPVVMKTEALMMTTTATTTCSLQTCNGMAGCYYQKCGGGCTTCP